VFQVFEDGALMDTLDGEVRADVEAAARILAKRTVAGCALVLKYQHHSCPFLRLMNALASIPSGYAVNSCADLSATVGSIVQLVLHIGTAYDHCCQPCTVLVPSQPDVSHAVHLHAHDDCL